VNRLLISCSAVIDTLYTKGACFKKPYNYSGQPEPRRLTTLLLQSTLCETGFANHWMPFVIAFVSRSAEFLGESDEKPFLPTNVAEAIRVFILDYFAYELRAALAELFKCLVDVVHGEHNAQIA